MNRKPSKHASRTPRDTPTPIPAFCAEVRPGDALVVLDTDALDDTAVTVAVDTVTDDGVGVAVVIPVAIVVVATDEPLKFQSVGPGSPANLISTAKNGLVKFGACQLPSLYRGSSSNTQPDSR